MSLSLNWERLSAKLGTAPKKAQKVQKRTRRNVSSVLTSLQSTSKQNANVHLKRGDVLVNSLWNTDANEKLNMRSSRSKIFKGHDHRKTAVGKYIAMDCEFVGVGSDDRLALARISIVNFYGHELLDAFVKPKERVTDWRTWVSGVSPKDMAGAITFDEAQLKVAGLIQNRILVGHALKNDLRVLQLSLMRSQIVDTADIPEYRQLSKGKPPGLRRLCNTVLDLTIQEKAHSSLEDARAAMALFRLHQYNKANTGRNKEISQPKT